MIALAFNRTKLAHYAPTIGKYYDENGYASSVGSGSKHCANACVDISSDVPEDVTCGASGSAISFDGRCDSRNYTYTPQCSFLGQTDNQNNVLTCTVTAKSCGCLWWEDDSDYVAGVNYDGKRSCDACAVHGMPWNGKRRAQELISYAPSCGYYCYNCDWIFPGFARVINTRFYS